MKKLIAIALVFLLLLPSVFAAGDDVVEENEIIRLNVPQKRYIKLIEDRLLAWDTAR